MKFELIPLFLPHLWDWIGAKNEQCNIKQRLGNLETALTKIFFTTLVVSEQWLTSQLWSNNQRMHLKIKTYIMEISSYQYLCVCVCFGKCLIWEFFHHRNLNKPLTELFCMITDVEFRKQGWKLSAKRHYNHISEPLFIRTGWQFVPTSNKQCRLRDQLG